MIKVILIPFVASLGAMAVAYGLWLEMFGEKDLYADINDFRKSETRAHTGLQWVFWGVIAEMALGFVVAAWDGWEAIQNDPMNRPITDISALVTFRVNRQDVLEVPHFGGPSVATLGLIEPQGNPPFPLLAHNPKLNGLLNATAAGFSLPRLEADKFSTPTMDSRPGTRAYFMRFHISDWSAIDESWMQRQAKQIDNVQVARIDVKFLPQDLQILDGSIKIIINSTVRKSFQIDPQLDNDEYPMINPNTAPYVIIATNVSPSTVSP